MPLPGWLGAVLSCGVRRGFGESEDGMTKEEQWLANFVADTLTRYAPAMARRQSTAVANPQNPGHISAIAEIMNLNTFRWTRFDAEIPESMCFTGNEVTVQDWLHDSGWSWVPATSTVTPVQQPTPTPLPEEQFLRDTLTTAASPRQVLNFDCKRVNRFGMGYFDVLIAVDGLGVYTGKIDRDLSCDAKLPELERALVGMGWGWTYGRVACQQKPIAVPAAGQPVTVAACYVYPAHGGKPIVFRSDADGVFSRADTTPTPSGATCSVCQEHNAYADPTPGFTCYSCRNSRALYE